MVLISVALSILVPNIAVFLNIIEALFGLGVRSTMPVIFMWSSKKIEGESKIPYDDSEEDIKVAEEVARR